jgi:hypothetical protein
MKRSKQTRKQRGGVPSQCISVCRYQCEGNCRKLCNVSKQDVAYHKYHYEKLKEKKELLVEKLEKENKDKLKDILKESKLSAKEQEDLTKILKNSDLGFSSKQLLLKLYRDKQNQMPLMFVPKQGGFNFLTGKKSYSGCEKDCRERCDESCEYLCGESVDRLSSMFQKEADVLESEISVLEEVHKLIRVV